MEPRTRQPSSPFRSTMAGTLGGPRLRSASPGRRALAIDMRRIASLLREPTQALQGTGESMNNSLCSSPNSAWEPGDRGAAPTQARAASLSRMVMQNQFTALAERINSGVTALQRQCEADRRRLTSLEKKLEAKADTEKPDGRERWAEVQGSVNGLIEETQALARRVDGLDERLWARTSGSEASKQRNRELEQQVQALEQQNRLAAASVEEMQKRQATKIRRAEHSLEEILRRLASVEDEARQRGASRDGFLEARIISSEQNQEALDAEIRALQANLEDGLQQLREELLGGGQEDGADFHGSDVYEAVRKGEMGLSSLDRKVTGQVEDLSASLASLRVKVDGVLSRVGGLAERIETAHEPSVDALRLELSQVRSQERRELDAEVSALKGRVQQVQDSNEEACAEVREALRQARAEIAALSYRPEVKEASENSWLRNAEERLASQEQELFDLRERVEEVVQAGGEKAGEFKPSEDLEDLRRRLDWLEEQGGDKPESNRLAQVQNTICELVEQVSKLKQQASSSESNTSSWQQQVKQIHSLIERRQNEDAAAMRVTTEVEAKVGALSSQVADLAARLLEAEGNLDFARENEASTLTEAREEPVARPTALQEKLEAVAEHLEVVDDLSERLCDLERRFATGHESHALGNQSPGPFSEVSFGGEAPMKASAAHDMSRELAELQTRMDGEGRWKERHAELQKAQAEEVQTLSGKLTDLTSRLGKSERLLSSLQEAPAAEVDALRLELLEKLERLESPGLTQVDDATTAATVKLAADMQEVKQEVEGLGDKVDMTLDDLKEGLVAAKNAVEAAMAPIKQELKDLRGRLPDAEAEASAEQALLEKLEEVERKIRDVQKEKEAQTGTVSSGEDLAALQKSIQRLQEAGAKADSDKVELEEAVQQLKDLPLKVQDVSLVQETLRKEVESLSTSLEEQAKKATLVLAKSEPDEDLRQMVEQLRQKVQESPSMQPSTQPSLDLTELREQMKQLEQKVEGSGHEEDAKLRSQVQQQVQDLGVQLSKEVANLAEHQKDICEAKTTVEELAKQLKAPSRSPELEKEIQNLRNELSNVVGRLTSTESTSSMVKKEVQDVKKEVADLVDRLSTAESASSATAKDLEALLGPKNKIGISLGGTESPLAEVCGRLDLLSEQVAELQNKSDTPGIVIHKARCDSAASADGSLNFSLTEQTERPGAQGGDSLNFSLTETAKDLLVSEPPKRPGLVISTEEDSDGAEILSASDSPSAALPGKLAKGLPEPE
ncbi:unnamed protein product, partial [Effrenium voratum]